MDKIKFKTKKSDLSLNIYEDFLKLFFKKNIPDKYWKFFKNNNVASPGERLGISIEDELLPLDYFLGRSDENDDDLIALNKNYSGRISDEFLAICWINEIDFICLGKNAQVFYWQREKNDLYFDKKKLNAYKKQDINLIFISNSFDEFLQKLIPYIEPVVEPGEDDYKNPNSPFKNEALDIYFKFPILFFKQNPSAIDVQLKKMSQSKRGLELLMIFKEKKLID